MISQFGEELANVAVAGSGGQSTVVNLLQNGHCLFLDAGVSCRLNKMAITKDMPNACFGILHRGVKSAQRN